MVFAKSKRHLLSIALFLVVGFLVIPQNARAQAPQIVSLYFSTTMDQININWITEYDEATVNVSCKLNDAHNCDPFPYSGDPGGGSCKIIMSPPDIEYDMDKDPEGELRTVPNTIYCKAYDSGVYDPSNSSTYDEERRTFFPLSFEVSMPPVMSLVVGEGQNLVITIKNNGTLSDTYKIEVISNNPEILIIENGEQSTQMLGTNDIQQVYVGVNALLSEITTASVEISSDTSQNPNKIEFVPDDVFTVRGGVKSLPDFGIFGIVQIMLIAAVALEWFSKKSHDF